MKSISFGKKKKGCRTPCSASLDALLSVCVASLTAMILGVAVAVADTSSGVIGTIDAIETEPGDPFYTEPAPGVESEEPRPSHPPIDQIPPVPMPVDREDDSLIDLGGPGEGVMHNPATGETVTVPVGQDSETLLGLDPEVLFRGGGYSGTDVTGGEEDLDDPGAILDGMNGNMTKINNVGSNPWRKNAILLMRWGSSWGQCSGTMRDAEVVLTAGHCVFDYGGRGWADEIWVYPGYDGSVPRSDLNGAYGRGVGTYFGSWTSWTNHGNLNYDVGLVRITRAVGMLTGWFGWAYGGSCSWHTSRTYHNASYPGENCPSPGRHNGRDMYYWSGKFKRCYDTNRLELDTKGGCFNAIWGGMSGSGAYYIDSGKRYVHGITSTSNRSTWGRYARQWKNWVDWTNGTFIPGARGSAFDLQALDANAAPSVIQAGNTTTLLNHLAANPTDGSANGTWKFGVYLSTNDVISTGDTLLSNQQYGWNFGKMSSVRVNMAQVTIPVGTPAGNYWLGVVYDRATDGVFSNNDSSGWDAVPIRVTTAPKYTLIVAKSGTGSGAVTSSPSGINCGSDCSESYFGGQVVTLKATAQPGSVFAGWSGDCSGLITSCKVTMSAARNVTAKFDRLSYILRVLKTGTGTGTVVSNPKGIDCGADCDEGYRAGTKVVLTATPARGSSFAGWSGVCKGTGTCEVTMDAAKGVTAKFDAEESYRLNVRKTGSGSGYVASNPSGIDCGRDCWENYADGTKVELTATEDRGSSFAGWTGACRGKDPTCMVMMDAAKRVTAKFNAKRTYLLKVRVTGNGKGTVVSTPTGIDCGSDCKERYAGGTTVRLEAKPDPGSRFHRWVGHADCRPDGEVVMNGNRQCRAVFKRLSSSEEGVDE